MIEHEEKLMQYFKDIPEDVMPKAIVDRAVMTWVYLKNNAPGIRVPVVELVEDVDQHTADGLLMHWRHNNRVHSVELFSNRTEWFEKLGTGYAGDEIKPDDALPKDFVTHFQETFAKPA